MAAVVWMALRIALPPGSGTVRATALTMPSLTVVCSPSGLPPANTMSP
jgi:hypothetical protein